jgi:hypothetical protein
VTPRRIKVAPGRAIEQLVAQPRPTVVRVSKAQMNLARAVQIAGTSEVIRDALEERGADRVSEAKRVATEAERDAHLDIAAELFTLARLA